MSHELERILENGARSGRGFARLLDVEDGVPEVVHLTLAPTAASNTGVELTWSTDADPEPLQSSERSCPGARLRIDTRTSPVSARCDLSWEGGGLLDAPVELVQTGSLAFTRNTPILESSALKDATVLCIGIGSGGSIVVDQLARAGVGRFILWDMDRLEVHNVGRHVCTLQDLGRRKVLAIRDHIHEINPVAHVRCVDADVLQSPVLLNEAVAEADCVIVGTDNNPSRFAINDAAWKQRKVALYGRAYTRAVGGDVIQVIPGETPCFACHLAGHVPEEEISSERDSNRLSYADAPVPIEPGLVIDIHPIANMLARLALLRLCESTESSLRSMSSETRGALHFWASRREGQFADWKPTMRTFSRLAIFRWYESGVPRDAECTVCGNAFAE